MRTKFFQLMLAALVVCTAMVFNSCSSDDNDNNIDNLPEKIIGKWITADMNGQPAPTNDKMVFTFVSTTKAYVSASLNTHPEVSELWATQTENDVAINGNKMTLTSHPNQHETVVDELTVTAINNSELIANRKLTVTVNGKVVISEDQLVRYEKLLAHGRATAQALVLYSTTDRNTAGSIRPTAPMYFM